MNPYGGGGDRRGPGAAAEPAGGGAQEPPRAPGRDHIAAVRALQQAAGNQAVGRILRNARSGPAGLGTTPPDLSASPRRVSQRDEQPLSATAPTTASIAVESDPGGLGFGGHAGLFLVRVEGGALVYYRIDLWVAAH